MGSFLDAAKQGIRASAPITDTLENEIIKAQRGYEDITRQIEEQEKIINANLSGNPDSYARRRPAEIKRLELISERQNVYGQRLEFLRGSANPQQDLLEFRLRAEGNAPNTIQKLSKDEISKYSIPVQRVGAVGISPKDKPVSTSPSSSSNNVGKVILAALAFAFLRGA